MFGERGWRFFLDEGAGGAPGAAAGAGGGQPGQGDGGQGAGGQGAGAAPLQFDAWIAGQPPEIKTLLDGHISGLKTALGSERERNKTLEKDLREMASKAEKGSDAEKQLSALANQVKEAGQKSGFYESAVQAGVTNLKLAYMAAVNDGLFKKDGAPDFEALKKNYPELFRAAGGGTNNAGSGASGEPVSKQTMDGYIRAKIGGVM